MHGTNVKVKMFLFCKSNCALSHSNTETLERNTISQKITQMQLPPPLVLLKLVTAVKGKDEVEPNVKKAYWGSKGTAPLLTTTLHGDDRSISRQQSFIPRGEKTRYPMNIRLGRPPKLIQTVLTL